MPAVQAVAHPQRPPLAKIKVAENLADPPLQGGMIKPVAGTFQARIEDELDWRENQGPCGAEDDGRKQRGPVVHRSAQSSPGGDQ